MVIDRAVSRHGAISSNHIGNAPLFSWFMAVAWALTRDPVTIAHVIASVNTASLYPLWQWARTRMDDGGALRSSGS